MPPPGQVEAKDLIADWTKKEYNQLRARDSLH